MKSWYLDYSFKLLLYLFLHLKGGAAQITAGWNYQGHYRVVTVASRRILIYLCTVYKECTYWATPQAQLLNPVFSLIEFQSCGISTLTVHQELNDTGFHGRGVSVGVMCLLPKPFLYGVGLKVNLFHNMHLF